MTTPIKTQCPHCHTIFNIKNTQLNQKTATVCCEHCQQMFLVNNNLIVTADIDSNRKLTDFLGSEPKTPIDIAVATTLAGLGCLDERPRPSNLAHPADAEGRA